MDQFLKDVSPDFLQRLGGLDYRKSTILYMMHLGTGPHEDVNVCGISGSNRVTGAAFFQSLHSDYFMPFKPAEFLRVRSHIHNSPEQSLTQGYIDGQEV